MQRYHNWPRGVEINMVIAEPCTDDDCTEPHVYVLTDAEYVTVNKYIEHLDYHDWHERGTTKEFEPRDDYIAVALAVDD